MKLTRDEAMAEREKAIDEAIVKTLATPEGRRVFFWLMNECAIYREPFNQDASVMSYTVGRQSLGRIIVARMTGINSSIYPQLLLDAEKFEAAFEELYEEPSEDID